MRTARAIKVLRACAAVVAVALLVPGDFPSAATGLTRTDLRWLSRVTFGVNADVASRYQQIGRERFLDEQLKAPVADAAELTAALAALPGLQQPAVERVRAARQERQQLNAISDAAAQQQARRALNREANDAVLDTASRHLLRAVRSPSQLREQMTWFWMNHFSVFARKANVAWTLAEYETGLREHAFGSFRDLVMTSVTAPAMLVYLDNAHSRVGQINENYARELMELHTLGVSGGPSGSRYTQQDVQELARVLTGVGRRTGVGRGETPGRRPACAATGHARAVRVRPARVTTPAARPSSAGPSTATASPKSRTPSPGCADSRRPRGTSAPGWPPTSSPTSRRAALVSAMAAAFERTGGSIAAVLREMFLHPAFLGGLGGDAGGKFKDPMQFVVSSLRLADNERPITNLRPAVRWLQALGQPLYGRVTPDGYALTEAAWTSSGQLVQRFEIARAIGAGNADLAGEPGDDPGPRGRGTVPVLRSPFFSAQIEPLLSSGDPPGAAGDDVAARVERAAALLARLDAALDGATYEDTRCRRRDSSRDRASGGR